MIELAISAIQAILQVMVIVLSGALLSYRGYINESEQKWLSKLNLTFFTPCLLFSNIASVISPEKFSRYWPIPLFYIIFAGISWFLCQLLTPFFRVSGPYERFITGCVVFNNANSLPVAIISGLAVSEAGKTLFWGDDDTQESASSRGIAYVLFFGLFSNLLRWSYGYNILKEFEEDEDKDTVNGNKSSHPSESAIESATYGSTVKGEARKLSNASSSSSSSSSSSVKKPSPTSKSAKEKRAKIDCQHTRQQDHNENEEATSLLQHKNQRSKANSVWLRSKRLFATIDKFMSPPLYAALLAIVVGLTPLKSLLYDKKGFLYASFTKGIESCGKASIPLVLVCLGAQLKYIRQLQNESDEPATPIKYRKPVFLSIFIRNIIMPCLVVPLVYLFARFGGVSELESDPMFIVSMIVVGCTPTAINLAQITQVNGAFEKEMLNVLFWSYGLVCIPVCTFVIFIGLFLVKHVL